MTFTRDALSRLLPVPFRNTVLLVVLALGQTAAAHALIVPGFFAADGQASQIGASAGTTWRARFSPHLAGSWSYQASFRAGSNVAIGGDPLAGSPAECDGQSGSVMVAPTDADSQQGVHIEIYNQR